MIRILKREFTALLSDRINGMDAKCCALLSAQYGNEGKKKLINKYLPKYDVCGKFNNGLHFPNRVKEDDFAFNILPAGVLYYHCMCLIGNGVIINPPALLEELKKLEGMHISFKDRLLISHG